LLLQALCEKFHGIHPSKLQNQLDGRITELLIREVREVNRLQACLELVLVYLVVN
jgi:hypothetical protein